MNTWCIIGLFIYFSPVNKYPVFWLYTPPQWNQNENVNMYFGCRISVTLRLTRAHLKGDRSNWVQLDASPWAPCKSESLIRDTSINFQGLLIGFHHLMVRYTYGSLWYIVVQIIFRLVMFVWGFTFGLFLCQGYRSSSAQRDSVCLLEVLRFSHRSSRYQWFCKMWQNELVGNTFNCAKPS